MFSSLLRPSRGSQKPRSERRTFSSPFSDQNSPLIARRNQQANRRRVTADFDDSDDDEDSDFDDDDEEEEGEEEEEGDDDDEGEEDDIEEDEDAEDADIDGQAITPLLPIFEASHLDSLPVYNLTHTIRLLIVPRCETTLSWDQLRSPQVSQFLVKPIQKDVLDSHFSRATIYALMANYLQFSKEAQTNPGNSGSSKTRAMVCELLAIKLLKEYSTRELIDALSYDFDPLQGDGIRAATLGPSWENNRSKQQLRPTRISALEIAIRGQAKRLLAHPLVVQQLEAIWAGTIVFHSAADSMHRRSSRKTGIQYGGYGAITSNGAVRQADQGRLQGPEQKAHVVPGTYVARRTVTLYDPCDASLFKLSRLRVPRYRHFFSTCSLAVLLVLFTAVLYQRSTAITTLEVIFWIWSAGFMLDEVVGFNEQGFSLYIMSFWNAFDIGILMVLCVYYCLRLVGIMQDDDYKRQIAHLAYDVLAVDAVLLFPRLFSVLDHYRYFSQLLIAFRMMAMDLIAILVLIVITCSGFFVAFSLGFGNDDFGGSKVVYALFQLLMGFTPAAWEQWSNYNVLGKAMLVLFLFITHFLVVTILITVLTNSFMAIVQNANDEHQFLFAVNTISMVKSDALFSYIAPTNVLAWLLTPLRFVLPMRRFVHLNRTVIKITHFPVLFSIYIYERIILGVTQSTPTEFIEQRGRQRAGANALALTSGLFSPGNHRLRRERSIATFQKDQALDEVFRRPFRDETYRPHQKSQERRKTSDVVNNWMSSMGPEGRASPPADQDLEVVARLERPRHKTLRELSNRSQSRAFSSATKSVASDPEEFVASRPFGSLTHRRTPRKGPVEPVDDIPQNTDADGDDELVTNDENDAGTIGHNTSDKENEEHYFQATTPIAARLRQPLRTMLSDGASSEHRVSISFDQSPQRSVAASPKPRESRLHHTRNLSSSTMIYNPVQPNASTQTRHPKRSNTTDVITSRPTTPLSRTPKRQTTFTRARPIMPGRHEFQSTPNINLSAANKSGLVPLESPQRRQKRSALALDLASDLGDNKELGGGMLGAVPASFATQMAWATGGLRGLHARDPHEGSSSRASNDDQARMSKLMLARMNELEQGFKEVLREVKDWRRRGDGGSGSTSAAVSDIGTAVGSGGGGGGAGSGYGARSKATGNYGAKGVIGVAGSVAAMQRRRIAERRAETQEGNADPGRLQSVNDEDEDNDDAGDELGGSSPAPPSSI